MRIKPFIAVRPPPAHAEAVASPPYDVVDTDEARALIQAHPWSFLRIVRSEAELAPDHDPYSAAVYERAAANYALFKREGYLERADRPAYYLYRLQHNDHQQTGLVAVSHIADYDEGRIKRHENTRQATEDDRTRHVEALNANTGPVFLTYRDQPAIDAVIARLQQAPPRYHFQTADGILHEVWEINDEKTITNLFAEVPMAYVADGHHRSASAARVARQRRAACENATGDEEFNWFLSVFFPAGQLRVLPYNRCVSDLNGLAPNELLKKMDHIFTRDAQGVPTPDSPGKVSVYLDGKWHSYAWEIPPAADPVAQLDVHVLQSRLLGPVLGIDDPRNNARISFVGGIRGTAELERRVDSGQAAIAFSMHPVTVDQLMAVSDAGLIMPPKSTWFEPKLRSGLLVHELD